MRPRSAVIRHLLSALVLGVMLLLGLGTTMYEWIDADIRTTETGLLVRYEADFDCVLGDILIRADRPDGRRIWFRRNAGSLAFGDSIEVMFKDFMSEDGLYFSPSDYGNPEVGVECINPPMGISREFVPLSDLDGSEH